MKKIIATLLTGALLVGISTKSLAEDLEAKATVKRPEAEKAALEKVPGGKVKDAELEEEDGQLIWSFDIAVEGSKDIQEVHVDANTGKVTAQETETPKKEKEEAEKEEKEGKEKKHHKQKHKEKDEDDDKDEKGEKK